MVTVQDIGLQLTKSVKELAQWNFPFSQTLEKYCSLFNPTCKKSFCEAGLVLQNSSAVYVRRVDDLLTETEYCRNVLLTHEQEEAKILIKKRDRKTEVCFHNFKTVNFAEEVDKNIDIKKNHVVHNSVKSKSRRFTQLEKDIARNISINIYDVNGKIIGKKYDFRCNQNISMDGILVDEFAPQDFCYGDMSVKEKSSSHYSPGFCDESISTVYDDNNENVNADAESERDYNSPEEEISDLVTSLEPSQQNLSLSRDTETDNTLVKTPTNISSDVNLTNTPQTCPNTPTDTHSSIMTNIDNIILSNNNDSEDQYLNSNIREGIDVGSLLDSPPESVNSKGRTSSTDDPALLNNGDLTKAKIFANCIQKTPLNERNKTRQCTMSKSKLLKRKLIASCKRRKSKTKRSLEKLYNSEGDGPNMFKKNSRACIKCIQEYDPLQYNDVTNAELDLLGFRLRDNDEPHINNNNMSNVNDDITIDDGISEPDCSSPVDMSPPHESFCDVWLQSDSPHFSPQFQKNIDKWHDMIQPKLHDAEQRSTFCIHDYKSCIIDNLKSSDQQKVGFDTIMRNNYPCEAARYFIASLFLASKQNVELKQTNEDPEQNIEIVLCEEDWCSTNSQADLHE